MNKLLYTFFILLLAMSACDNSEIVDSNPNLMTRSGVESFSLFKDIDSYTNIDGSNYISGKIYCTEKAEYTFTFAFEGTNGSRYEAGVGTKFSIYPYQGSSFRTISAVLEPGVHYCFVTVKFSGSDQHASARLVITKINNEPLNKGYEGYVDLVAGGYSNIHDGGGTIPGHWRCGNCGLLNSWIPNCSACGATNHDYNN